MFKCSNMMLDMDNVLKFKSFNYEVNIVIVISECYVLGLLRVPDSCEFPFPSAGHNSWVWS